MDYLKLKSLNSYYSLFSLFLKRMKKLKHIWLLRNAITIIFSFFYDWSWAMSLLGYNSYQRYAEVPLTDPDQQHKVNVGSSLRLWLILECYWSLVWTLRLKFWHYPSSWNEYWWEKRYVSTFCKTPFLDINAAAR